MNIVIALSIVLIGCIGLYVLKLNETKKFLNKAAFNFVSLIAIFANFFGAFCCIFLLFQ